VAGFLYYHLNHAAPQIDYSGQGTLRIGDGENPGIEERVNRALTQDLPRDLEILFGVNVDVQIKGTREGSLIVFFGAVIAGVSALSRYKNLYDSVVLIQNQAPRVIHAALNGSGEYSVGVHAVDPSERSLEDPRYRWWRRRAPFSDEFLRDASGADDSQARHRRDGFFWFLLALCILEGLALGMLVYMAVLKTFLNDAHLFREGHVLQH
jgi:hypothetical protein